jgi:hypothetical protein
MRKAAAVPVGDLEQSVLGGHHATEVHLEEEGVEQGVEHIGDLGLSVAVVDDDPLEGQEIPGRQKMKWRLKASRGPKTAANWRNPTLALNCWGFPRSLAPFAGHTELARIQPYAQAVAADPHFGGKQMLREHYSDVIPEGLLSDPAGGV